MNILLWKQGSSTTTKFNWHPQFEVGELKTVRTVHGTFLGTEPSHFLWEVRNENFILHFITINIRREVSGRKLLAYFIRPHSEGWGSSSLIIITITITTTTITSTTIIIICFACS